MMSFKMHKMLWLIASVGIVVPSVTCGEVPEALREMGDVLHAHCSSETSVNKQHIEDAKGGKFSEEQSFKCYLRCLYEETSMITDDGKFDGEALLGVLPPEISSAFENTVRACVDKNLVGVDECESMWLVSKCFQELDPVNFFVF